MPASDHLRAAADHLPAARLRAALPAFSSAHSLLQRPRARGGAALDATIGPIVAIVTPSKAGSGGEKSLAVTADKRSSAVRRGGYVQLNLWRSSVFARDAVPCNALTLSQ